MTRTPPAAATAAPSPAGERAAVPLLAVLIALQPLSVDLFLPALPDTARALDVTAASVQSTLTVFIAVFALVQLVAGPLSDRFGRRPVVLGGVGAYVAGSAIATAATTLEVMLAARVLQAAGCCCAGVCARAIVRDRYEPALGVRRLSQAMSWVALVPMLAPVAGGLLVSTAGWRAGFATMLAAGLAALVLCAALLVESNSRRDRDALRPGPLAAAFAEVLRSRTWQGFAAIGSAMFTGLFAFLAESAFALGTLHGLSPWAFGVAVSLVTTQFLVGTVLARRLLPRLGVQRLLAAGCGLAALAGAAMLAAVLAGRDGPAVLVAAQALFVLAHGLVQPAWQAGALAPFGHRAGTAAAATGFVQHVAAAAAGALLAWAHDGTALPMAAAVAAAGALAWLASVTIVRRHGGVDRAAATEPR